MWIVDISRMEDKLYSVHNTPDSLNVGFGSVCSTKRDIRIFLRISNGASNINTHNDSIIKKQITAINIDYNYLQYCTA